MNKHNALLALILGLLAALGPLCLDLYLPALPDITKQMNTSTSLSQVTLTAALFGLGLGQLIFGPISDKVGRKLPLLVSLGIFIATSIWCAFTSDIHQLILARFIQGLAGSGGAVLSRAIARDHFSGTDLTRFFVLLMAINGVAPILAPVAGGFQLSFTPWQGLFISLAIIGTVLFLLSAKLLKESHHPASNNNTSMLSAIKHVMSERKFLGMNLAQGFMLAGMFAYIGSSSYVFQGVYKLSPQGYSYIFAFNGLGLITASYLAAKLSRKWGEINIVSYGLILAVASASLLLISGLLNAPLWVIIGELFITIAFTSGMSTLINSQAMQLIDKNAGVASACLGTLMFVMGGISAPLTSIGGASLFSMTFVLACCYLLALLCWFFITRPSSLDEPAQ